MADIFGCEPLRVWCRLEPRARTTELDAALRAEVADAAWILGRQWQFGEFKGEDSGSAVLAKLAARTAAVKQVRLGSDDAPFVAYSDDVPLEAQVEREASHREDLRARARAGHALLAFLDAEGQEYDNAGGTPPYDPAHYRQLLRTLYPFAEPSGPTGNTAEQVRRAALETNVDAIEVLAALSGRAVDALQLFDRLPPGPVDASHLPSELALGVIPGHADLVVAALRSFQAWCVERFGSPETASAWDDGGLEYRFDCQLPHPAGGQLELSAGEYTSGRLDWYAFDVGAYALSATVDPSVELRRASVIPAPAEFPGMPLPRFWQMEDGAVDLGHLTVDTTDIAKVVVAEFALLFGNNWFVQPWSQPAGTLARVDGIVVTDVFGQRTLVRPSVKPDDAWSRWEFFSLSAPGRQTVPLGEHLFLPPSVGLSDEGAPVEAAAFLRDENANMVWAVERTVPDLLGSGRNGNDAARLIRNALAAADPLPPPAPAAPLWYELGGSVPENWIPFIPVHRGLEDRAIQLQRASMPRFLASGITPVRPRTRLLRVGIDENDGQSAPYFVHEEEIPRTGVVVEASPQRTRWYDGATFVWLGRRTVRGSGEGGSGLRFDVVHEPGTPTS